MSYNLAYKKVEAAVREYALKEGDVETWEVRWALSRRNDFAGSKDMHGSLTPTYCAQVIRALNKMSDEGLLVKTGSGQDIHWRTPEKQAAADNAARKLDRQAAQWRDQSRRLAELGYAPRPLTSGGETWLAVPPDQLEEILALLSGMRTEYVIQYTSTIGEWLRAAGGKTKITTEAEAREKLSQFRAMHERAAATQLTRPVRYQAIERQISEKVLDW